MTVQLDPPKQDTTPATVMPAAPVAAAKESSSGLSPDASPKALPHSGFAEALEVDIAIVGGAMAGATLALSLDTLSKSLARPLKIALIEARSPLSDRAHPGFDARAIAIAQGSIQALSKLGVWRYIEGLGTAIEHIHVSDRGHFGMTELSCDAFGLPYLGQVVELEAVGKALFAALEESRVALFCPDSLSSIVAGQDKHQLQLTSGQMLNARLVVAADGLSSAVRSHFKLPLEQVDFGQHAVIANVAVDKPHQHWAWERFTDKGPLALLPMASLSAQSTSASRSAGRNLGNATQANPRLSLVWAMPPADARLMSDCSEDEFISALQRSFGYRAGNIIAAGARHSYELKLSWMPRPIHHRCVFVGNAAQTLHPIAGQGFNLGLRDVADLVSVLRTAIIDGRDVGDTALLHRYLQCREPDRQQTLLSIEALVRGFSNQYWPLVVGRNLALRLLSWCPPLKAPLASRAMGWPRGARLSVGAAK